MCTLLHHPRILFWTSRPTESTRFSRRDFWAILYQLLQDGITIS